jgi:MoxR-like ATPase
MASNQPGAAELDEARVIALVKEHSARPTHHVVEVRSATGTTTIADAHMNMADCLDAIQSAPGVYMPGPAGSGKSTIGKHMAKALNVPFYFENALQSQYALTGYQDAHGNYVTTDFRRAYENGGLFLFDEIDASNPGACVWFNGAVAGDCATFPDGLVEKHPDFYCAAAANTFGNGGDRLYVGRNQLDAATLDRFVAVVIDYDPAIESAMANGNSQWMAKVQKIRAAVAALKIRAVVTPRATMAGAALIARGWTEEKTMQATIWKGLEADTVAKIKTEAGV